MVKMINRMTGTAMFVDDSRVSEYKAQGHVMASAAKIREKMEALEKAVGQGTPAKTTAKKTTAKKPAVKKATAKKPTAKKTAQAGSRKE